MFCRTRLEVDSLVETLNAHGYRAEALHGGMQQRQREAVMGRFRAAKADLLIATDVAARGLDIGSSPTSSTTTCRQRPRPTSTGSAAPAGPDARAPPSRWPNRASTVCCGASKRSTKQRIEVANVPTVADLRARRLEITRASLRERLLEGNLDDVRVVVEALAEEFDMVDIAAAAIKLAHAATASPDDGEELDVPGESARRAAPPAAPRAATRAQGGGVTRLFIGAGRRAGIRPADLVGAIANEAGLSSRDLGQIEIGDNFSIVEVPEETADQVISAMKRTSLRGKKVTIRRDRDA